MAIVTKQDAAAKLAATVSEINKLVGQAENLADEYGLEFHLSHAYGMGGSYLGKGKKDPNWDQEEIDDWDSSDEYESSYGWSPSSQSC